MNRFGKHLNIQIYGESHGEVIGLIIDGLPAGVKINHHEIKRMLEARKPRFKFNTNRIEQDDYEIVSGYYKNHTTGSPLHVLFKNENKKSKDYSFINEFYRNGHADMPSDIKSNGHHDNRGGGHFSGRLTAPLVFVGGLYKDLLRQKNIRVYSHISRCGNIMDDYFGDDTMSLSKYTSFMFNKEKETELFSLLEKIKEQGDSIGGVTETFVEGLEIGLGDPFFDSFESILSHLIFSIPSVKGLTFGSILDEYLLGSQFNDLIQEDLKLKTNHSGGINGGLTNGSLVRFQTHFKPISTISIETEQYNKHLNNVQKVSIPGRHDSSILTRVMPVVDAMTYICIMELIVEREGKLWMI
jgi:chorismate synthase